jgi:3D (Asp-Asp-Asp) domain-containing protein
MINILTLLISGTMALNAMIAPVDQPAQTPVATETAPTEVTKPANGRVVTVTAYTSEPRQTDSTPCIASDGSDICKRYAKGELICAAGDRNVPLGSKFYVEGYGTCTVADRMNIRYNGTGRVDIYLGYDTAGAFNWGKRQTQVALLK